MTASSDARERVRAPETGAPGPNPGLTGRRSAYTRAISREGRAEQGAKVKKTVSLHVVDAEAALRSGWALTEAPPAAVDLWREVLPAKGEASGAVAWAAMSAAGLFRAITVTVLWLLAASVRTRIRAGVAMAVLALVAIADVLAHAIHN